MGSAVSHEGNNWLHSETIPDDPCACLHLCLLFRKYMQIGLCGLKKSGPFKSYNAPGFMRKNTEKNIKFGNSIDFPITMCYNSVTLYIGADIENDRIY